MNKKGDFDFEWLPGFREMMACQNEEQNTQQETDWGNENLQIEALLPPEQLQQKNSDTGKTTNILSRCCRWSQERCGL